MSRASLAIAAAVAAVGTCVGMAEASAIYTFNQIGGSQTTVASQLSVEVSAFGANQVDFTFRNSGPSPSSITAVYFDDGTLLGIASIFSSGGVSFAQGASPPNLPGGDSLAVPFQVTAGFLADSNPPVQPNGVNPGEWLTIRFNLINNQTYNDTIAALEAGLLLTQAGMNPTGTLRMGIQVQGLENGGSAQFVNGPVIPLPSAAAMGLAGLLVVARRRRLD